MSVREESPWLKVALMYQAIGLRERVGREPFILEFQIAVFVGLPGN